MQHMPPLIFEEKNTLLLKSVYFQEVEYIVMDMYKGKATCSNGFIVEFYKIFWTILVQDIWQVVDDSICSTFLLSSFNASFIFLIPKYSNASSLLGFLPIALYNVIYKIIFKTIVNHLQLLLPSITTPQKTRYVEGCQIFDNIILTKEHMHSLSSSKQPRMFVKLDMSKSFHKVS